MGLVDPQQLHPEAADAVPDDVEAEEARRPEVDPLVDQQQHADAQEAPERLVEEGRVEGRVREQRRILVLDGPVRQVDLEAPREVGRLAVELLVEVVAPAPDRLREEQARRDHVHEGEHALPGALDHPGANEHAAGDPAPDPEAALPDRERLPPLLVDGAPARDDVVDARSDDPAEDAPHGDAEDEVAARVAPEGPAPRISPAGQPGRRDDAQQEHRAHRRAPDGPELDLAARRARDRADQTPTKATGRDITGSGAIRKLLERTAQAARGVWSAGLRRRERGSSRGQGSRRRCERLSVHA